MSRSLATIMTLTVGLAVAVAVPATGGAATDAGAPDPSGAERQLRTDAGPPSGQHPRARRSAGPFCVVAAPVCARVGVAIATGIAGKIAGRGSNAVKSAAKEAAKKQNTSFPKLQTNMKKLAREGRAIRRSKAYRKKLWNKVLKRFRRNLGPATKACLFTGVGVLAGGGSIRAAIAGCVAVFASVITGKPSRSASTAQAGQPVRPRPPGPRPRAHAPGHYPRALAFG